MVKLKSVSHIGLDRQIKKLSNDLVNDCSVRQSGVLQVMRFRQSPDGPEEGVYVRIDSPPEVEGADPIALAWIVSPYDLLCLAHQILEEFDPSKKRDS